MEDSYRDTSRPQPLRDSRLQDSGLQDAFETAKTDRQPLPDAPLQLPEALSFSVFDQAAGENIPPAKTLHRTVPNFGDAILFTLLAFFFIFLLEALFGGIALAFHLLPHQTTAQLAREPKLIVPAMALAYLFTLLASALIFPLMWRRGFFNGIRWHFEAIHRFNWHLPAIGIAVGLTMQLLQNYLPMPKTVPMDDFFRTRVDIWIVTAFGTLIAPAFEEITFRGMLLPAIANVWDWLSRLGNSSSSLEPAAQTISLFGAAIPSFTASTPGLIASSILTSVFFAFLHSDQLGHSVSPLILLFSVSLVLTAVRVRTGSVAASALVHASYNFSVFITMFIATGGYRHLEKLKP
ncbi:MAG: CPBP family intramembrane glutamic endopeptidase [Acidobacteriaceae bacterium]